MRTTWSAISVKKLSDCHLAGTIVRSPAISENVIRVRSNPVLMLLVRMLMMMVETHQYVDPRNDSTHNQKNHYQSDITPRTFCKDNTSQDHFRSVNLYKEFAYRSEIE